jgi:transmembrane sensor
VRVTGTAFRLSWNVFARSLEVEMRRGSVVVTGPGLEPGQRVSGTERFVTRVTSAVTSGGPVASSAAVPARTPDEAGGAAQLQPRSAPSVDGRAITPTAPAPPTRAAAAAASAEMPRTDAGAAPERTASAPAASARSAADATSAQELLALADEARFARRPEAAREALLGVRRRYPGSAAASEAAFLLGRLADDAGDLRTAVTWYDRHAREAGSLTPEALGRKMLALHRLGDLGARDRAARDYLARFPDGPYARQARELTAR